MVLRSMTPEMTLRRLRSANTVRARIKRRQTSQSTKLCSMTKEFQSARKISTVTSSLIRDVVELLRILVRSRQDWLALSESRKMKRIKIIASSLRICLHLKLRRKRQLSKSKIQQMTPTRIHKVDQIHLSPSPKPLKRKRLPKAKSLLKSLSKL